MKRRLYIDEVGNSDMGASQDPNQRYLSLTGVVLDLAYVNNVQHPRLDLKRRFFHAHVDEPVVLHRKELVNRRPPFEALRDPVVEVRFNRNCWLYCRGWISPPSRRSSTNWSTEQRYQTWRYDPYHYCLHVLIERYVLWLRRTGGMGDVMAESRGTNEDKRLKESFERVCREGTEYATAEQITGILTSRQLKVKPKAANLPEPPQALISRQKSGFHGNNDRTTQAAGRRAHLPEGVGVQALRPRPQPSTTAVHCEALDTVRRDDRLLRRASLRARPGRR
jgi:hypothetical protein